ncbi:MAG: hypothetical protein QM642_09450 [Edaphocola sp.]
MDEILRNFCKSLNSFHADQQNHKEAIDGMVNFLELAVNAAKTKDTFGYWYSFSDVWATANSNGSKYSLDYDHIYGKVIFHSDIIHPENIKNLKDGFLLSFFDACLNHDVHFQQEGYLPKAKDEHPHLYKITTGNLFLFMRWFFLDVSAPGLNPIERPYASFVKEWDSTTPC